MSTGYKKRGREESGHETDMEEFLGLDVMHLPVVTATA